MQPSPSYALEVGIIIFPLTLTLSRVATETQTDYHLIAYKGGFVVLTLQYLYYSTSRWPENGAATSLTRYLLFRRFSSGMTRRLHSCILFVPTISLEVTKSRDGPGTALSETVVTVSLNTVTGPFR